MSKGAEVDAGRQADDIACECLTATSVCRMRLESTVVCKIDSVQCQAKIVSFECI